LQGQWFLFTGLKGQIKNLKNLVAFLLKSKKEILLSLRALEQL
tara:strand:- start:1 stop:129 length:129 start_codon:yes stop_codon:yes gene_type:complete